MFPKIKSTEKAWFSVSSYGSNLSCTVLHNQHPRKHSIAFCQFQDTYRMALTGLIEWTFITGRWPFLLDVMTSSDGNICPRYWPLVWGIHRSPVNSPHSGQWRGTLMFSLICDWINGWVYNREVGDLRRHRVHFDVTVMRMGYGKGNVRAGPCFNIKMPISPVLEIPLWRYDGHKIVLSPQWDFLYW